MSSASSRLCLLLSLALLGGACRSKASQAADDPARAALAHFVDASPHLAEDAEINDLRINYLDWGGSGPALVMVHGFGDNPHVFDDLAPLLKPRLHVLAYARRGHGDSDSPPRPYDLRTLTSDLRRFLDALRIERAHLLGWSTGGNEITRFATLAPERVGKLVYLEDGYDWSNPAFLPALGKMLAASAPDDADRSSLEAYRHWYEDAWLGEAPWTAGLEAMLRNSIRLGPDGRVSSRMKGAVADQIFASLAEPPRDYTRVHAPVLALYSTTFFPNDPIKLARARAARDFEEHFAAPFRRASMERARRELGDVTVRQVAGTTHMSIGVRDVETLAATIGDFLTAPPAGAHEAPDGASP